MILRLETKCSKPAAFFPILGAFGYALSMLSARVLGRRESAAAMAFWGNVTFLLLALGLAAVFALAPNWGWGASHSRS